MTPAHFIDDPTLIGHLMAAAATVLDRVEAARRRKLPFFGNNAKLREAERRATLERVAAQRAALSAARVGLPQVGFLRATRAPEPACGLPACALSAWLVSGARGAAAAGFHSR